MPRHIRLLLLTMYVSPWCAITFRQSTWIGLFIHITNAAMLPVVFVHRSKLELNTSLKFSTPQKTRYIGLLIQSPHMLLVATTVLPNILQS